MHYLIKLQTPCRKKLHITVIDFIPIVHEKGVKNTKFLLSCEKNLWKKARATSDIVSLALEKIDDQVGRVVFRVTKVISFLLAYFIHICFFLDRTHRRFYTYLLRKYSNKGLNTNWKTQEFSGKKHDYFC